jgi:hypothetical protein
MPPCQADFSPKFNDPQEAIMAKGRNQERSQKKVGKGVRDESRSEIGTAEDQSSRPSSGRNISPADVARKHQRRFGHN